MLRTDHIETLLAAKELAAASKVESDRGGQGARRRWPAAGLRGIIR